MNPTSSTAASKFIAKARRRRMLNVLTVAHAAGIAALWYVVWGISEQHWLGSVVTFLPRLPWLVPGGVLLLASILLRSRAIWINLAAVMFGLVAVGGFNIPWATIWPNEPHSDAVATDARVVRLVSANVQNFEPDFSLLLREIMHARPDVVAFQEAFRPPRLLAEQFPDWQSVHVRGFWVGSKWPVKLLGQCDSDVYRRETAIAVEITAPFGSFVLTDLHLMTARKSLRELRPAALLTGDGPQSVKAALLERDEEARQTRVFMTDLDRRLPMLVCGDFNMPTSSSIHRTYFGDFTNAFEATSWGFGYTAPCRPISIWPRNTPWQRVDHIVADSNWKIRDSRIGQRDGSDHRLITATLLLQPLKANSSPNQPAENGPPDLSAEVDQLR